MEHEKAVKEALNALYHHPDDTVRVQADRWLQNFQGTLDAWQASYSLPDLTWIFLGSIVLHSLYLVFRFSRKLDFLGFISFSYNLFA